MSGRDPSPLEAYGIWLGLILACLVWIVLAVLGMVRLAEWAVR